MKRRAKRLHRITPADASALSILLQASKKQRKWLMKILTFQTKRAEKEAFRLLK